MMKYASGDDDKLDERYVHYQHTISELERSLTQEKDEMKREMEKRILNLADDFHAAANTCMHSFMQRTIRDNLALHAELEKMIEKCNAFETKVRI